RCETRGRLRTVLGIRRRFGIWHQGRRQRHAFSVPVSGCSASPGQYLYRHRHRRDCSVRHMSERRRTTADEHLLAREDTTFLHTDRWRIHRITSEFVLGFDHLAEVGLAVAVFGSARTRPDDPMYEAARATSAALVEAGFDVITGGGPGVMEAANMGAAEAGGR